MLYRVAFIRGSLALARHHPPRGLLVATRSNNTIASSSESPALTADPAVNKILEDWPGELRNRLNYICSMIKDNQLYKNEARIRYIDTQEWESYNFKFRRHLMVLFS